MAHVITDKAGEQYPVELVMQDGLARLLCTNSGELLAKASVVEGLAHLMTFDPVFSGADLEPQVQRVVDAAGEA